MTQWYDPDDGQATSSAQTSTPVQTQSTSKWADPDTPYVDTSSQTVPTSTVAKQSAPSAAPSPPASWSEWAYQKAQDAAAGVNQAVESTTWGLAQLGTKGLQGLGAISPETAQKILNQAAYNNSINQADYSRAQERSPYLSTGANIAANIAMAAPIPGGIAGGFLKRAATGAVAGAALGASQYAPEGSDLRVGNAIQGAAYGVLAPVIGKTVENMSRGVDTLRRAIPAKMQRMADKLVPEGYDTLRGEVAKHFENMKTIELPENKIQELLSNPTIAQRYLKPKPNAKLDLEEYAPNTAGRINSLRSGIQDDIDALQAEKWSSKWKGHLPDEKNSKLLRLQKAESQLRNSISELSPDLAIGLKKSQRLQIADKIINSVKDTDPNALTLNGVYNKLLNSYNKQDSFIRDIAAAGGDVQQAKKVINILGKIKKATIPTNKKLRNAIGLDVAKEATGYIKDRATVNKFIDLLTDDATAKELNEIVKLPLVKAIPRFFSTIGKGAAGIAAQNKE